MEGKEKGIKVRNWFYYANVSIKELSHYILYYITYNGTDINDLLPFALSPSLMVEYQIKEQ